MNHHFDQRKTFSISNTSRELDKTYDEKPVLIQDSMPNYAKLDHFEI
jgi:hypothetical protein